MGHYTPKIFWDLLNIPYRDLQPLKNPYSISHSTKFLVSIQMVESWSEAGAWQILGTVFLSDKYCWSKVRSSWVWNHSSSVVPSLQFIGVQDLLSVRDGSPSSYLNQRQSLFLSRAAISDPLLPQSSEVMGSTCPSQSGSVSEYQLLLLCVETNLYDLCQSKKKLFPFVVSFLRCLLCH